jgi:hypothetical protein
MIKIQNGTPKSGKSLCTSCKHLRHVKGQNLEEIAICSANMFGATIQGATASVNQWSWLQQIPGRILFKVEECSSYADMNTASLEEMQKIAWEVTARKRGGAGFAGGTTNPDELETVITPPKDQPKSQPATITYTYAAKDDILK